MPFPRCDTVPLTGATVGVPMGDSMSTPLCARPPERDAPQVSLKATGPCTGQMIPPTGADTIGVLGASRSVEPVDEDPLVVDVAAAAAAAARRLRSASWRSFSSSSSRSNSRSSCSRRSASWSIAAAWASRLSDQRGLGHLEVLRGGRELVDGVLVALGGVLRERLRPGLGVEIGIGVRVPGGVIVDEPLDDDAPHRIPQRVDLRLRGGLLRLERLDVRVELAELGLRLREVGRGLVRPCPRGLEVIRPRARRDGQKAQQHGQAEQGT